MTDGKHATRSQDRLRLLHPLHRHESVDFDLHLFALEGILIVAADASSITVASAQPYQDDWQADLARSLGRPIRRVLASPAQIRQSGQSFQRLAQSDEEPKPGSDSRAPGGAQPCWAEPAQSPAPIAKETRTNPSKICDRHVCSLLFIESDPARHPADRRLTSTNTELQGLRNGGSHYGQSQ